jgi:hypothetical protein
LKIALDVSIFSRDSPSFQMQFVRNKIEKINNKEQNLGQNLSGT